MVSVTVTLGRVIVVAAFAIISLLSAVTVATAHPFFNSSEPGCDGSDPNVLMCDDFEDGSWFEENADVANSNGGTDVRTDGWAGRIRDGYPHAICGGTGAGGTKCTARSILQAGAGGSAALADHNLAPGTGPGMGSSYNEVYLRFYMKVLPGYVWNDNQKFVTWNPCCANAGGIVFGAGPTRNGDLQACPFWDCNLDSSTYRNPQNGCSSWFLCQNQGKDLSLSNLVNHWVYIEIHIKLNTPGVRNGLYRMWVNDCGTNGLGCTGAPTLRMNYTNVGWRPAGENRSIGVIFFDIWGNPSDVGTMHIDQIKASRVGPIGFMGSSGASADLVAPGTPSGVVVQ